MAPRPWAEPALRRLRYVKTLAAVKRYERDYVAGAATPPQASFNMRSAMDLGPRTGRRISRTIRHPRGGVPTLEDATLSRFVDPAEIPLALEALNARGHYAFSRRVDKDTVERMRSHALSVPAVGRGHDGPPAPYRPDQPAVGRYDVPEEGTLASEDMQDFCTDPALARIAALYLGQPVIQDQTALWWTNPLAKGSLSVNAMQFHQDRDRLLFLKFFVYLTDVGADEGPHAFIEGTHRHLARPLRSDGRKTDEDIAAHGLGGSVVEHIAPAGTILAVDTVALHKGTVPAQGSRCVLQVEYATSLFGAEVEFPRFVPSPVVQERLAAMPRIFQRLQQN